MSETTQSTKGTPASWGRLALRGFLLLLGMVSIYFFLPTLLSLAESAPQLEHVKWRWFLLMGLLMTGAFASQWALTRIAAPGISWFVAATSQLTSNAAVKVVPGGVVAGGAFYFRMLAVSGVPMGTAITALAAVGILSNLVLLALPAVAVVIAVVSAPIPEGMLPVAIAGTVMFVVMFSATVVIVTFDRPLHWVGWVVERVVAWAGKLFKKDWSLTAEDIIVRRDEVVSALGKRWHKALAVAVSNWLLDYATLVVALIAVGANPRPSLILLAFAGAAVLGMIPITPGGLGFVEAGLVGMLTIAGIPAGDALLATLAYRLFQFWLPIPIGFVSYALFRRRYGKLSELPGIS
ncbi:MAG: lysylphosphatidylglycerol synthase transmembrane domain-containing protein [Actinomycetota bacterium]|nr:lysylphosphatidylglycerol synthase transmembrane domain-containing protein [Actinomycetota bacterium]